MTNARDALQKELETASDYILSLEEKVYKANIQTKRFYIPEEGRWVRLKVSTRALRSITKDGLRAYAKKHRISI